MAATVKQAGYVKGGITRVRELTQSLNEIDPTFVEEAEKEGFDVDRAFQLYAQFCGDVERTGHALGVPPVAILRAADRLKWNDRLKVILELKQSGKPGELERGISRAMNFVQAHRMRVVLERLLKKFYDMPDEELFEAAFTVKVTHAKDGTESETRSVNTKPFADLAAALEKCQQMTYTALGDTVTERAARHEDSGSGDAVSATQLHSIIASAMAGGDPSSPAAQLLQEQLDASQR
jgi:hypothetical protein